MTDKKIYQNINLKDLYQRQQIADIELFNSLSIQEMKSSCKTLIILGIPDVVDEVCRALVEIYILG